MITVFFLLFSISSATITQSPDENSEGCDIVPVTECPVTCGGGFQLMKYQCVEKSDNCNCPKNPIFYQCNNRPCLGKNPTMLDKFYDEENERQEANGVEYIEESGETVTEETSV